MLGMEFEIKDVGPLHYFVGLEVASFQPSIHSSQTTYASDLLSLGSMIDSHSIDCQVATLTFLWYTSPQMLLCIIIWLDYIDCINAVNYNLHYLERTLDFEQVFHQASRPLPLHAFCDVMQIMPGCPNTRRSTTGFCVFLVLISSLGHQRRC